MMMALFSTLKGAARPITTPHQACTCNIPQESSKLILSKCDEADDRVMGGAKADGQDTAPAPAPAPAPAEFYMYSYSCLLSSLSFCFY